MAEIIGVISLMYDVQNPELTVPIDRNLDGAAKQNLGICPQAKLLQSGRALVGFSAGRRQRVPSPRSLLSRLAKVQAICCNPVLGQLWNNGVLRVRFAGRVYLRICGQLLT